jgi:hypothetical protein
MKLSCTHCESTFSLLSNLTAHKKNKHAISTNGTCECGKTFEKAQSLNAHYRHCLIHRNGEPVNRKTNWLLAAGDRGRQSLTEKRKAIYKAYDWDQFSRVQRRTKVMEEQSGVCLHCGINEWAGQKIVLELDHINGNHDDNARSNLRMLCPNCHSLTPTHRNKKRINAPVR